MNWHNRIAIGDLVQPGLSDAAKWGLMLRHFLANPDMCGIGRDILQAMYQEYQAAKKREGTITLAQLSAELDAAPAADPLAADLAALRPYRDIIVRRGKANKSAIARLLQLPAGGSAWQRIGQLAELLEQEAANDLG